MKVEVKEIILSTAGSDRKMVNYSTKSALADASAGIIGSLVAMLAFYPVDVIKVNLQASNSTSNRTTEPSLSNKATPKTKSRSTTLQDFLSFYFRGVHFKISHTIASSFAYFFLYSWIQSTHRTISRSMEMVPRGKPYNYQPRTSTRLLLAAFAAMMNTCLTLPLDVLSARSQSLKEHPPLEKNSLRASDVKAKNVKNLWKGLWPALLLCSNPSIHYTVFDIIKAKVLSQKRNQKRKESLTWLEAFLFGMIAKFVATIVTYPLIRAKVILMVNSDDNVARDSSDKGNDQKNLKRTEKWSENETRLTRILISTYQKEGIAGLYKGCNLQLLHTLLKSALLMMVRERITATTRGMILGKQEQDRSIIE